ncbi:hypothetical protein GCM10027098_11740 [Bowmanella dokdonensis]
MNRANKQHAVGIAGKQDGLHWCWRGDGAYNDILNQTGMAGERDTAISIPYYRPERHSLAGRVTVSADFHSPVAGKSLRTTD